MRHSCAVDDKDWDELKQAAVEVMGRAYAPYSHYPVGAAAVTDDGRFRFAVGDEPLAGVIAFDPYDSCHIVIGTHQRGILRSTDGGSTWKELRGSSQVTYPTSVYFPSRGEPIVSTYGRGSGSRPRWGR